VAIQTAADETTCRLGTHYSKGFEPVEELVRESGFQLHRYTAYCVCVCVYVCV